jgi:6-oxocyclohex-1-ene-1-carbonyl-CoA hydrolase
MRSYIIIRFGHIWPDGSAPDGGSSDFLPWMLSNEDAMWNCVSCEMWSAYKMKTKNLISKVVPVLKVDGKWVRNPMIITDKYVEDGEIVYGEYKSGDAAKEARAFVKEHQANADFEFNADFELLDKEIDKVVWTFANLFPGCLIKSIDGIRMKKKYFWDICKNGNRHWLAANRIPLTSSSSARTLLTQDSGMKKCSKRFLENRRSSFCYLNFALELKSEAFICKTFKAEAIVSYASALITQQMEGSGSPLFQQGEK